MLATAFNLPKWLLAAVVFCVVIGHLEQVKCKLQGCGSGAVESAEKTSAKNDPSPKGESDRCACACHTGSTATFEIPQSFIVLRDVEEVRLAERYVGAPETLRAEIEYPPRSFRA
jgi:hypothetical protein